MNSNPLQTDLRKIKTMELEHSDDGCTGLWFTINDYPEDPQPIFYITCGGCAAEYEYKEVLWREACRQNKLDRLGIQLANQGARLLRQT